MKRICRELQERMALEGARALREDEAAARHLEGCDACFQALEGLAALDQALSAMTPVDAPESAVRGLMERVAAEPAAGNEEETSGFVARLRRWPFARRPLLWSLAPVAGVVLVTLLLTPPLHRSRSAATRAAQSAPPAEGAEGGMRRNERPAKADLDLFSRDTKEKESYAQLRALGYVGEDAPSASDGDHAPATSAPTGGPVGAMLLKDSTGTVRAQEQAGRAAGEDARRKDTWASTATVPEQEKVAKLEGRLEKGASEVGDGVAGGKVGGAFMTGPVDAMRVGGAIKAPTLLKRVEPVYPPAARQASVQGSVVLEVALSADGKVDRVRTLTGHAMLVPAAAAAVRQWVYAPTLVNGRPVPVVMTVTVTFRLDDSPKPSSSLPPVDERVRAFLEERAAVDGLAFQEATGYWRNTYLPGDPQMRRLQARLSSWDTRLAPPPHETAAPPLQPFDAPRQAALGVYVHADRNSLDGPQRMLVQVGLQAAPRIGGARPAMNVGVVLDLRGDVATDVGAAMRALAVAFSEARQAGDRFHLIVAGKAGGVVVGPEAFRHGPLTVALDRLLAGPASGDGLDLPGAVAAAFQAVCPGTDAEEPFGTSAVVLVTGQAFGPSAAVLHDLAHQGAVAGIPLTTVGVGADAATPELDTLALAGQGRRRLLGARDGAARIVDEELYAASNAVARAVRLRIRLAPGVRLVDVIGSRRLDEAQAERVREAERSLDLRLARYMGIEADRGDDEDGIQIVIPSFQAGDSHAILLDVVAPGPGAVADVSVRYKDVAFLRNGVARAGLTLPGGRRAAGPLERNVLKNLLAFRVSSALSGAGDAAGAGDLAAAAARIADERALLAALRMQLSGLAADADLARDIALLDGYTRLLGNTVLAESQRALIADSLRYAGRLKLRRHA